MIEILKANAYFAKLNFTNVPKTEILLKNVPSFRKEKFLQYLRVDDRLRCLYSWKLLEKAMQDIFSLDIKEEYVSINPYGKPFITNKKNIHFNLSHSGEIVACILDVYPVGIDVESIIPTDMAIASNFFSTKESSDLFILNKKEQVDYFYNLWTLKESYIKAEGKGLSIPLNDFSFKIDDYIIHFEGEHADKWDFALFDVNTDDKSYQLGLCVYKSRKPDKIVEIDILDLM